MKREVTWEFKEDAKRKHPYLSEQGRELKKAASLDHVGRQPVFDMTLDLFGGKDASYVTQVIWLSSKEGACKTLDDHSTLCLARTVMQEAGMPPMRPQDSGCFFQEVVCKTLDDHSIVCYAR
ncbi:hypothetical protein BT93_I0476 [Corymbia citriodora subsp. variegata]|nr:hypothetical protein BT93_I0476 [Corymbia citriodora subsp. variegata]